MYENPRKPGSFGEERTGVERERGGRFRALPKCDFCGKPISGEHYSDTRVCGGGDGPGFFLCDRKRCMAAREKLEAQQGLQAVGQHYAAQRAANEGHTPNARGALKPGERLETRGVLAGRYRGRGLDDDRTALTHAVVVGPDDRDVRVLCGFRVEGMADSYSATDADRSGPPTCPRCFERWGRLQYPRPGGVCQACGDLASEAVTFEDSFEVKLPLWFNDRHRALFAFYQSVQSATMADALRAVPEAKVSDVKKLVDRRILISAPSPGRGHMLRLADQWAAQGHTPNASHYWVWLLDYRGVPIDEGPYGPYEFTTATQYARIGAQNGKHDRVVSLGQDPEAQSFKFVRRYRRGTGEQIL